MLSGRMFNSQCGRQNNIRPPKDIHVLNPGTCEFVTLQGKRDFVVKDLEMGRLFWIIQWANHKGFFCLFVLGVFFGHATWHAGS